MYKLALLQPLANIVLPLKNCTNMTSHPLAMVHAPSEIMQLHLQSEGETSEHIVCKLSIIKTGEQV